MLTTLTVVRYRTLFIPFAFLSMAIFRLPLVFQRGLTFWKLMGCGKNGTFDIIPDFHQWAMLGVWETPKHYLHFKANSFLSKWWKLFAHSKKTYFCEAIEAHGKWDKKNVFETKKNTDLPENQSIAVLTRATIRLSKLRQFWKNVPSVAASLNHAGGFIESVGIGEVPFIKQATFSVWENMDAIKQFAYRQKEHAEVIKKTRKNDWYSEELFARFSITAIEVEML